MFVICRTAAYNGDVPQDHGTGRAGCAEPEHERHEPTTALALLPVLHLRWFCHSVFLIRELLRRRSSLQRRTASRCNFRRSKFKR